jgi:hypothetical protein
VLFGLILVIDLRVQFTLFGSEFGCPEWLTRKSNLQYGRSRRNQRLRHFLHAGLFGDLFQPS